MISEVTSGSNSPYFPECMDNASLPSDWYHAGLMRWVGATGKRGGIGEDQQFFPAEPKLEGG